MITREQNACLIHSIDRYLRLRSHFHLKSYYVMNPKNQRPKSSTHKLRPIYHQRVNVGDLHRYIEELAADADVLDAQRTCALQSWCHLERWNRVSTRKQFGSINLPWPNSLSQSLWTEHLGGHAQRSARIRGLAWPILVQPLHSTTPTIQNVKD